MPYITIQPNGAIMAYGCQQYEGQEYVDILPEPKLTLVAQQEVIRSHRQPELMLIDNYQLPLRWEGWTIEQQDELKAYRQAWLNAPQTLIEPERPAWMGL